MNPLKKITRSFLLLIENRKVSKSGKDERIELTALLNNLPGMVYSCFNESNWTMTYVSMGAVELTEYLPDEIIHNKVVSYKDIIHPDDRDKVWEIVQGGLKNTNIFSIEYRIITKTGKIKYVWERGHSIISAQNELLHLEGYITDITEHKQAEETIIKERTLLRTLIDNLPNGIFIKDKDYRKIIANEFHLTSLKGHLKHCGIVFDGEILGKTDFEVYPKEYAENYFTDDQKVIRDGQSIINKEEEGIDANGNPIWLIVSKVPLYDLNDRINGMIGITTNITEHKMVQEEIIKERTLLKNLINNLPVGIFIKDKNYRKIIANELHLNSMAGHLKRFGIEAGIDLIGKTDFEVSPKEWAEKYFADDQKVIRDGQSIINKEEEGFDPGGNPVWLLISKIPLRDKDGNINGMIGITTNITERKLSEEALIKERTLLRTIIDNIPLGIFVKNKEYQKIIVNPAHEEEVKGHLKFLGMKGDIELLGKTDNEIFPEKLAKKFYMDDRRVIENGEIIMNEEGQGYSENRKLKWLQISKIPLRNIEGKIIGMVGITNDITIRKKTEDLINESARKWQATFNGMKDSIMLLDPEGKILQMNITTQSLLNIKEDKAIGRYCYKVVHKTDCYIETCPLKKVKNSKERETSIQYINNRWLEFVLDPILDENKKLKGIVHIVSDITERKLSEIQLREKEVQYRNLADTGLALIWTSGTDKLCNYFNEPWLRFTGRTIEQEMGNGWAEGLHPDDFDRCLSIYINSFDKRQKFDMEYRLRHSSGEYRWIRDLGTPNYNSKGEFIGYIGHCFDISHQKLVEEELIKAKEKAEESDRLKSIFLANMSHEIRTPMNSIIGFTKLLAQAELTLEKKNEYIQLIMNSGNQLLTLINDILEISKIESDQLSITKRPCDFHRLLHEIFINFNNSESLKRKNEIKLVLHLPENTNECIIETDQDRVNQVLNNLIHNAIKFTEKGFIEIGYNIIKTRKEAFVECYIKDTGKGIPDNKKHIIFQRFRQVDEFDYHEGTGIGLSISKGIIEKLGGKIWFESKEGSGSSFFFSIPYSNKYENVVIENGKINKKTKLKWENKLLLLAEDDLTTTKYIKEIFENTSTTIVCAANGLELLDLLEMQMPDLILIDISMPVLNGYDTIKIIREKKIKVPVIAQTAYAMSNEKEKILQAGFNAYISKPFSKEELIAIIEQFIIH